MLLSNIYPPGVYTQGVEGTALTRGRAWSPSSLLTVGRGQREAEGKASRTSSVATSRPMAPGRNWVPMSPSSSSPSVRPTSPPTSHTGTQQEPRKAQGPDPGRIPGSGPTGSRITATIKRVQVSGHSSHLTPGLLYKPQKFTVRTTASDSVKTRPARKFARTGEPKLSAWNQSSASNTMKFAVFPTSMP